MRGKKCSFGEGTETSSKLYYLTVPDKRRPKIQSYGPNREDKQKSINGVLDYSITTAHNSWSLGRFSL